jgi:hypothetical protein
VSAAPRTDFCLVETNGLSSALQFLPEFTTSLPSRGSFLRKQESLLQIANEISKRLAPDDLVSHAKNCRWMNGCKAGAAIGPSQQVAAFALECDRARREGLRRGHAQRYDQLWLNERQFAVKPPTVSSRFGCL